MSDDEKQAEQSHPPLWTEADFAILDTPIEELSPDQYEEYTRARTVKLWYQCQTAKKAELDKGKDEHDAHEAAKVMWNAWARSRLSLIKELEDTGKWQLKKWSGEDVTSWMEKHNMTMSHFLLTSIVNFSFLSLASNDDSIGGSNTAPSKHPEIFNLEPCAGQKINLSEFIFPTAAVFSNSVFNGSVEFGNALFNGPTVFDSTRFLENSSFHNAQFHTEAIFSNSTFQGEASFSHTTFQNDVEFRNVIFQGRTGFDSATFHGTARFNDAEFHQLAGFTSSSFLGTAGYEKTEFRKLTVFQQASFSGPVKFSLARFSSKEHVANFHAINSKVSFTLRNAWFRRVPDFMESKFEITPRLDDVRIEDTIQRNELENDPRGLRYQRYKIAPDRDTHARYRRLKQLADEGHNHMNALHFFAQEMRARRFWVDFPSSSIANDSYEKPKSDEYARKEDAWLEKLKDEENREPDQDELNEHFIEFNESYPTKPPINILQFWLGIVFEKISDFGQSVFKPLAWWFAFVILSALFYYFSAPSKYYIEQISSFDRADKNSDSYNYQFSRCFPSQDEKGNPVNNPMSVGLSATQLSLSNAFFFLPITNAEQTHNAKLCLYGSKTEIKSGAELTPTPHILLRIWGGVHTLVSVIFLFLIGLALRNRFKIS